MTFDLHFHANMYDEFLLLSNHIYDIVELVWLKIWESTRDQITHCTRYL